jgi:hypothetical protein
VQVDNPGHDDPALRVDHGGVRSRARRHVGGATDGDDAVSIGRECTVEVDLVAVVHRDDGRITDEQCARRHADPHDDARGRGRVVT